MLDRRVRSPHHPRAASARASPNETMYAGAPLIQCPGRLGAVDVALAKVGGDEVGIAVGSGAIASTAGEPHFNERSRRDHVLGLRVAGTDAVDEDLAERARFAAQESGGGAKGAVAED